MTDRSVDESLLARFADAWNRQDVGAICGCMTEDCVMTLAAGPAPWGARSEGRAEIERAARAVFERIPDVRWEDAEHTILGDRGMSEWTIAGTPRGGQPMRARGVDVFRFRDGLIARKDTYLKKCDQ